jgi:hypothetical protein
MKKILTGILLLIGINAFAQVPESGKDEAWKKTGCTF